MLYFDHNSTTPLSEEARLAWLEVSESYWLNPSSPYRAGAQVRVYFDRLREELAGLCGVSVSRIIFNSGATEGNNMVFLHWLKSVPKCLKIAVSPTEHPSVLEPAKALFGDRIVFLELNDVGQVDVASLSELLVGGTIGAVSVMAANNETGLLNDWGAIAALCAGFEISFHCDASQWVGKMSLDGLSKCSFVTACGHKFGGSRGVGFLVVPDVRIREFSGRLFGGNQQEGVRAGTEDVAGVASLVAALRVRNFRYSVGARDIFIASLKAGVSGVSIIGEGERRLWNTVSVLMPRFASARWIRKLEHLGFLVSAGSACSTGKEGPSHVLAAYGVDAVAMSRVLRISSGPSTSEADWLSLADAIVDVWKALQSESEGDVSSVVSI